MNDQIRKQVVIICKAHLIIKIKGSNRVNSSKSVQN